MPQIADKRTVYEGQAVIANRDIKVEGNRFVSVNPSSYYKQAENCNIGTGTTGVVDALSHEVITVRFNPGKLNSVTLDIARTVMGDYLRFLDKLYDGV